MVFGNGNEHGSLCMRCSKGLGANACTLCHSYENDENVAERAAPFAVSDLFVVLHAEV